MCKGLAIQKRILLQKGFYPIVPRTERKDAWPSMKLTRGEVALHGAVVFARAAAHWDLLEILVRKFKRGNQLVR